MRSVMRNTNSIASLDLAVLEAVTGGCMNQKQSAPPPQAPPPQAQSDGGTSVEVATGEQGGALIQQALQGGATSGAMPAAPQPPRMI